MVEIESWISKVSCVLFSLACFSIITLTSCEQEILTNNWLVEITGGGEAAARDIAKRAGFTYVSPVRPLIIQKYKPLVVLFLSYNAETY